MFWTLSSFLIFGGRLVKFLVFMVVHATYLFTEINIIVQKIFGPLQIAISLVEPLSYYTFYKYFILIFHFLHLSIVFS